MPKEECQCAERFLIDIDKKRVRIEGGEFHDCRYIASRNTLLPSATREAYNVAGGDGNAFTRALSILMDAAARKERLV